MRSLTTTIDQIIALLPVPAPPELADELIVLTAELNILRRTGAYTPPEAAEDPALWQRLATALYRYLPKPGAYAFAQKISTLVTGVAQ